MKPSRLVTSGGGVRRHTVRGMRKITKAALVGGAAAAAIAATEGVAAPANATTDREQAFLNQFVATGGYDFGIARPLDDTGGLTTTNMAVGTVAYAAPEQLMGEAIDGRAELEGGFHGVAIADRGALIDQSLIALHHHGFQDGQRGDRGCHALDEVDAVFLSRRSRTSR